MKKLLLPTLALLAVSMFSCTEGEYENVVDNEPVAVTFGQSLGIYTKAPTTGSYVTSGANVGIYATEYTESSSWASSNFMDNISLKAGDQGKIDYANPADQKYYSIVSGTKYNFYAYSPSATETLDSGSGLKINAPAAGQAPTLDITLKADPSTQIDLLYAKALAQTKTSNAVALNFDHVFAQLVFKVQKEEGVAANKLTEIKIHTNGTAKMNLGDGTLSEVGGAMDITTTCDITIPAKDATDDKAVVAGSSFMIFPNGLVETNPITFTIDGNPYAFTPATATFTAGHITTITVTIKQTGVTFSQTLTEWVEDIKGTGEIE